MADPRPTPAERIVALLEVLVCSDFPTQAAITMLFSAFGYGPSLDGKLTVSYITALLLTDAVLLIGLILLFLRSHGERPREVFLGSRPPIDEAAAGIPMSFIALGIAFLAIVTIQAVAPWLRRPNPLQEVLSTPRDAAMMAVVLVIAGGIREELQRAFMMRRFERSLGGPAVGVVVASVGFGAGHVYQGIDVAIVTGLLGAFWAVVYLRRRSVMAPIVSHSGFNLLQLGQLLIIGR